MCKTNIWSLRTESIAIQPELFFGNKTFAAPDSNIRSIPSRCLINRFEHAHVSVMIFVMCARNEETCKTKTEMVNFCMSYSPWLVFCRIKPLVSSGLPLLNALNRDSWAIKETVTLAPDDRCADPSVLCRHILPAIQRLRTNLWFLIWSFSNASWCRSGMDPLRHFLTREDKNYRACTLVSL